MNMLKQILNKLKRTNETVIVLFVFLIIALFFIKVANNNSPNTTLIGNIPSEYGFICPSDFKIREDYKNSVKQWAEAYHKDYPNADIDELIKVRDGLIKKYGCGSAPLEEVQAPTESQIDTEKLMAGIKYAESQREDKTADSLIVAKSEKEFNDNLYIKHIRVAFSGYLDGTNNGVEEGVMVKSKMDRGLRCGLDSFNKDYYKSEFFVIKVEKNDYGGIVAYIVFRDNLDTVFWAWIYQYGGGEYILRGFCEYSSVVEQP